eukprot:TRINITY_DN10168_c0_g1_i1.p1 TRINITY_DN10168_c0_g1~~TRINITY_DN10168_c0_g1_i1.p1  ORF type:complete len:1379 (-),score=454.82 TRINITY_DN10168_c0_g1_i1:77-3745(-)
MTKEEKQIARRGMVLKEVFETETRYVGGLQTVVDVVIRSLEVRDTPIKVSLLDKAETAVIFTAIEQLYHLNTLFLRDLSERMQSWTINEIEEKDKRIGDLFLKYGPLFNLYGQYASQHDVALAIIAEFKEKKEFNNMWANFQLDSRVGQQTINGFLIMPCQRVPRYRMLLEEIVKLTPEYFVDYEDLCSGLKTVEKAATFVNETIRNREAIDQLAELQAKFINKIDLIDVGRCLVREGKLTKVCRSKNRDYTFHLFNDTCIYSEQQPLGLKVHRVIDMEGHSCYVADMPDTDERKNAFQICSSSKSFMVMAKSPYEKKLWMKDFQNCSSVSTVDDVAPVWLPDGESDTCNYCSTGFTVTRRRHHCRKCGALCCGNCSAQKRLLENISKTKPVRCCDVCAEEIDMNDRQNFRIRIDACSATGLILKGGNSISAEVFQDEVSKGEIQGVVKGPDSVTFDSNPIAFSVFDPLSTVISLHLWTKANGKKLFVGQVHFHLVDLACGATLSNVIPCTEKTMDLEQRQGKPGDSVAGNITFKMTIEPPPGVMELSNVDHDTIQGTKELSKALKSMQSHILSTVFPASCSLVGDAEEVHSTPPRATKARRGTLLPMGMAAMNSLASAASSASSANISEPTSEPEQLTRSKSVRSRRISTELNLGSLSLGSVQSNDTLSHRVFALFCVIAAFNSVLELLKKNNDARHQVVTSMRSAVLNDPHVIEIRAVMKNQKPVTVPIQNLPDMPTISIHSESGDLTMIKRAELLTKIIHGEASFVQDLVILESAYVDPLIEVSKSGDLSSKARKPVTCLVEAPDTASTNASNPTRKRARMSIAVGSGKLFGLGKITESSNSSTIKRLNTASLSVFLHSIKQILCVNQQLYSSFVAEANNPAERMCIGPAFDDVASLFKIYANIITQQDSVLRLLSTGKMAEFLETLRSDAETSLDVYIYSIGERVNVCVEDLKRLQDLTPGTHPDFDPICSALRGLTDVREHIEQMQRRQKNYEKLKQIEDKFTSGPNSSLLEKDRYFINEGTLRKVCRRKTKEFQFFLFSDTFIYAHSTGMGKYKINRRIALDTLSVTECEATSFNVISPQKSFVVKCNSSIERDRWVDDIDNAIIAIQSNRPRSVAVRRQSLAPVWVPDAKAKSCSLCEKNFSTFNRRHHCRVCGSLVCAKCSRHRQLMPGIDASKPVRVCDNCHDNDVIEEEDEEDIGDIYEEEIPAPERPVLTV